MLKCSIVLYVHNNEETILKVMDSLAKINGNFRREFIIIDDGSVDGSLQIIKKLIKTLPRVTVITQEHSGSAISINKALRLIKSDYVHFVSSKRATFENETTVLINACIENRVDVAFYSTTPLKSSVKINNVELIEKPLAEILNGLEFPEIRDIGKTCGLVSYDLLMKIGGADEQVYASNPSIALRCAVYGRFATILQDKNDKKRELEPEQVGDISFNIYNNMSAIYNFANINSQLCESYIKELTYFLYTSSTALGRKMRYLRMYLTAKYLNKYDLGKVMKCYRLELDELFKLN